MERESHRLQVGTGLGSRRRRIPREFVPGEEQEQRFQPAGPALAAHSPDAPAAHFCRAGLNRSSREAADCQGICGSIPPPCPWLPPAAPGQLTPVSSFSHLVALKLSSIVVSPSTCEPGTFPNPSAGRGSEPQRGSRRGRRCHRSHGEGGKLKPSGGKAIRAGGWARNNRPWILAEDPRALPDLVYSR